MLELNESNLFNASSSFSQGVCLSQEVADHSEADFCSMDFCQSTHSLLATDINCTTGAFPISHSSHILAMFSFVVYLFLSLNSKYLNAVLASHCLILFCTAALATIFGKSLALSILNAKSGSCLRWL